MSASDVSEQTARRAAHGAVTSTDLSAIEALADTAQATADAIKAGAAGDADTLAELAGKISAAATALKGSATAAGDTLGELEGRVVTLEGAGGGGASLYSPDVPYDTPNAVDDEFNGGVLDAKWTVFGANPVQGFSVPSCVRMFSDNFGVGAGIVQDVADATAKYRCKVFPPRANVTSQQFGLVAKAVGSNAAKAYFVEFTNFQLQLFNYSNYISGAGSGGQVGTLPGTVADTYPLWIEADYNSATNLLIARFSRDGVKFQAFDAGVTLTGGLDKIGIHCVGGGAHEFDVDWFRKLQGSGTGIEF